MVSAASQVVQDAALKDLDVPSKDFLAVLESAFQDIGFKKAWRAFCAEAKQVRKAKFLSHEMMHWQSVYRRFSVHYFLYDNG